MKKLGLILCSLLLLSGCGWWSADEEIEPASLVDFDEEIEVQRLWSVTTSGLGEKYQSFRPALLADRIYIADESGNVYAYDRNNGDLIWKTELETTLVGGVGVGDGRVLVSSEDGRLYALKALDGERLWQTRLSSEALSPAQANAEVVVVQTIDGRLTAYDPQEGQQLWVYNAQLPPLTLRGTSTPLLTPNAVFAGFASGKVVALQPSDGTVGWEARIAVPEGKTELERIIDIDGTLLLDGGRIYATSYQGQVAAIVAREGRVAWRQPMSSYRGLAQSLTQVLATDAEGSVVALDQNNGLEYWKQDALFYRQVTAPVVVDSAVAVADYEGYVHFLSPQDGRFVGRYRVDSSGVSGPMVTDGEVLYVLSNSGRLTALSVQE